MNYTEEMIIGIMELSESIDYLTTVRDNFNMFSMGMDLIIIFLMVLIWVSIPKEKK